jgi:hypothetical protein
MQPRLNVAASNGTIRSRERHSGNAAIRARTVAAWLRGAEARALDEAGLIWLLGRHLYDAGLGFDRLIFHVGTLHPGIFTRILAWAPNQPVEVYERDHPAIVSAGFPESPLLRAAISRDKLIVPAVDPQFLGRTAGPSPQGREPGELVSAAFGDRNGRTVVVSFCVARPNIFSAADHLIMDSVIAALRRQDAQFAPKSASGQQARTEQAMVDHKTGDHQRHAMAPGDAGENNHPLKLRPARVQF